MLHLLAPFGKNGRIDNKTVFTGRCRPVESGTKMPDKAPVKGSPTPLAILEPVEGVFSGLKKGVDKPPHEFVNAVHMQENQIDKDEQKLTRRISIPFPYPGPGQMTLDAKYGEQFLDSQIEIRQGHLEHRFDLSLKRGEPFVIHMGAPLLWCFCCDSAHLNYHNAGAFSI
jgi:hypothetical protein